MLDRDIECLLGKAERITEAVNSLNSLVEDVCKEGNVEVEFHQAKVKKMVVLDVEIKIIVKSPK